jgi:hypothetical protein
MARRKHRPIKGAKKSVVMGGIGFKQKKHNRPAFGHELHNAPLIFSGADRLMICWYVKHGHQNDWHPLLQPQPLP